MEVVAKKSASLLLYKKNSKKPYKKISFDEEDRIGDVWFLSNDNLPIDTLYNYEIDGHIVLPKDAKRVCCKGEYGGAKQEKLALSTNLKRIKLKYKKCPVKDMVVYLAHIRGFSGSKTCDIKEKKNFKAMAKNANYLKELGVNTIELMPVYDFDEVIGKGKINYWGYTNGNYYAPKPSYAYGEDEVFEFREMIEAFHALGIDVILQFFFTDGITKDEVIKIFTHWIKNYGIDGFNIVSSGIDIHEILASPYLAGTRIFGNKSVSNDSFVCDEAFMYDLRKFIRGDDDSASNFLGYLLNDNNRVNFAAYNNGYTLIDTFSYEQKHNTNNGEGNRDGVDYNCSKNFGFEGETDNLQIMKMRYRAVKNAFLLTLLSRGIPRIYMGDEVLRTQLGNNNAYCMDCEESYLNYAPTKEQVEIREFLREAIKIKREIFKENQYCSNISSESIMPRYSVHQEDAWQSNILPQNKHFGVYYEGKEPFFVAVNMSSTVQRVGLAQELGKKFVYLIGTTEDKKVNIDGRYLMLEPFSVVIYSVKKRS